MMRVILSPHAYLRCMHVRLCVLLVLCACVKTKRRKFTEGGGKKRTFKNPITNLILWKTLTENLTSHGGGRKGEIWRRKNVKLIDHEAASRLSSGLGLQSSPQEGGMGHLHCDRPPALDTLSSKLDRSRWGKPKRTYLLFFNFWLFGS